MKINTDLQPKIRYDGWTIESHKKMGKIEWKEPELYLSEKQKNGYIEGTDLRKKLEDKPVLNARVLDYLLDYPDLIPESWKGKYVYFWGTIFRSADGRLYVEYFFCHGGRWYWDFNWLDLGWLSGDPAASLARMPLDTGAIGTDLALEPLALRVKSLEEDMEKIKKFLII